MSDYVKLSVSTAKIYLFPVGKNSRRIESLYFRFRLRLQSSPASRFALAYQISFESDHPTRSYDVIKILNIAAADVATRQSTSGLLFDNSAFIRMCFSLSVSYFLKTSQSRAKIQRNVIVTSYTTANY